MLTMGRQESHEAQKSELGSELPLPLARGVLGAVISPRCGWYCRCCRRTSRAGDSGPSSLPLTSSVTLAELQPSQSCRARTDVEGPNPTDHWGDSWEATL